VTAETRRITFTHVPKAGGVSVQYFLQEHVNSSRVRHGVMHEHFLVSAAAEPDNLFITMLRDPMALSVSFYTYVNERRFLPRQAETNKLWVATFRRHPTTWSADPFIQKAFPENLLGHFLRDVENITDSISVYDATAMNALPTLQLRDTVPGTLVEVTAYTKQIPVEYQCSQYLEVGFILLKHYEVVGTLEKADYFYRVLEHRAGLPLGASTNATKERMNASTLKMSSVVRAIMEENLRRPLYCATVLWRIVGMISEADMKCMNTVTTQ
jgi:hypothetical protein